MYEMRRGMRRDTEGAAQMMNSTGHLENAVLSL